MVRNNLRGLSPVPQTFSMIFENRSKTALKLVVYSILHNEGHGKGAKTL